MDDGNSFLERTLASGCSILTRYLVSDTGDRQTTTGRLLSLSQGSGIRTDAIVVAGSSVADR